MEKYLYIAEKPSVAQEFAKALHKNYIRKDGYLEAEDAIVTWCVGHLITMSYPDKYDERLKKWSLDTLPFLPEQFRYEVIPSVAKQFKIVSGLLNDPSVTRIYVCTDSGREGEYIYRLVEQMAQVKDKDRRRVWIDSQTEEEILRGIREAKDLSAYDHLSESAYLRAKEDYLMGINFSRVLSLKYANGVTSYLGTKYAAVSVGRVMTCVLGMVVRREREIRSFVKTPFYRVIGIIDFSGSEAEAEWKAVEGSAYFQSPLLYKENGFSKKEDAQKLIDILSDTQQAKVARIERKKENRNAPLLFNLAELQNECSRLFKISPDQTLQIAQELYEKKLTTYPRTDARVLSTAVSKVIQRNISGLGQYEHAKKFVQEIMSQKSYEGIAKTRYVNDKQITDHYAIIPTGQGLQSLGAVSETSRKVYEVIVRRFLSIFYPPAVYQKITLVIGVGKEQLFSNFRTLVSDGYLKVTPNSFGKKTDEQTPDGNMQQALSALKKGSPVSMNRYEIREGETSPPKRYTSGSMILAMENAGQLIEDEELRAQIKGSGIGTSATRAEILKKLVNIKYLKLNKKTQVITPEQMGEMVYDVVYVSIRQLLNPSLTASWEKGLNYVAEGSITTEEYMQKLENFVRTKTEAVKQVNNQYQMRQLYDRTAVYYGGKHSGTGKSK